MKEKIKRLFPYIAFFLALFLTIGGIVSYFFIDRYEREKMLYLQSRVKTADVQVESLKLAYDTIAKTMFDSVINTPHVVELIGRAARGSEKEQDLARCELYAYLARLYGSMESHDVRQLHFHLPGSVSFLRFHRPEKFGDSLQGVRPSIDSVNRLRRPVNGFEEGRIFNGFRHVFPLFERGEFIGTVELSYSFDAVRRLAQQLTDAKYDLILDRNVIDTTVFADERSNYFPSALSPGYLNDKKVNGGHHSLFPQPLMDRLNALYRPDFERVEGDGKHHIFPLILEGTGYLLLLNPLESFDKKRVGYILVYQKDTQIVKLKNNLISVLVFASLLIGSAAAFITYFIYRLRKQHTLLVKNANTDKLTQIANRAHLIRQIDYLVKHARRGGYPLSVIFFDIDHFKQINDANGHRMGDQALIDLSTLMKNRLRESDIVGRWGGEEFVVILPHTNLIQAADLAEKLRVMIEQYPFAHGKMSCSFGVAELRNEDTDESLINRADAMLYEAKENGRNQVRPDLR
ncbi:MAG: diguanylate cyclase [Campylobacterales bacterium]|nr:diguanylate cyclase [Campylobacterales bacterium]